MAGIKAMYYLIKFIVKYFFRWTLPRLAYQFIQVYKKILFIYIYHINICFKNNVETCSLIASINTNT